MSLEVKYTSRGTAIVTCGGLSMEIPLTPEAGLIGQTLRAEPAPKQEEPTPAPRSVPTRSSDEPEPDWPAPKEGPGVMLTPMARGRLRIISDAIASADPERVAHVYLPMSSLRSSQGRLTAQSRQVITKAIKPGQRPGIRILDVGVPANQWKMGVDVTEFEGLFKDKDLGLDAVRLVLAKSPTRR